LPVPHWETTVLDNGTRLVEVNMGTQSLVSLEIIHFASRVQEDKKGASRAVARLLREGTTGTLSKDISEKVDYHGASLSTGANLDFSFIKLFTLSRHFKELLPIVKEVRYNPVFPQSELDRYVENNIQKLAVDAAKVELQAYKAITEHIYGDDHPYGYNSDHQIFKSLRQQDLQAHFENCYGSDNCIIILSGRITPDVRAATIEAFGKKSQAVLLKPYQEANKLTDFNRIDITASEKSQSGLKIGTPLFNRAHADFPGIFVLNTVLGGYFGSRLMMKIREEKGYTYSIYSGLDMMKNDGYFFVSTEVANEYLADTIGTVYEEIEKLKQELVPEEELTMIKNYLRGNFLNMLDGPFKVAGLVKLLEVNNLPKDFFTALSEYVGDVSSEKIRQYARQYLKPDEMVEVVVG